MTNFHDHFSGHAPDYAQFRPHYPQALFDWLFVRSRDHKLCWDVASGSGQAALPLAAQFAQVVATEASAAQIAHAPPHPRVRYLCEPAENCSLPDACADLVTVAQALHWFDAPRFFGEVLRVLNDDGLFAAWCYELMAVDPAVDAVVLDYYHNVIGPYWPPERRLLERGYIDIAIPLQPLEPPQCAMTAQWSLAQFCGYMQTWSATQRGAKVLGRDPMEPVVPQLAQAWGDPLCLRTVTWPLVVRAGRRPPR